MAEEAISVIKVKDVLIVTMPSDAGDAAISALQDKVLTAMARHRPKGVVLDITTVGILDSFFSRTLTETAQMVTLMGGKTVVVGMRPSVAITTMQLGLVERFANLPTALNVDYALDMLIDSDTSGHEP